MKLNILRKFLDKKIYDLENPILQIDGDNYRFLACDSNILVFSDWFKADTAYKAGYYGLGFFRKPPYNNITEVKNFYFKDDYLFVNDINICFSVITMNIGRIFANASGYVYTSVFVDKETKITKSYEYQVMDILFAKHIIDKLFKVFKVDCISFDIYKSKFYPVAVGRINNHNFIIPCEVIR